MAIENYSTRIEAVCITFLVLTWIFVCLRCYVRLYIVKGFGLDDSFAVLSLLLFTAFCGLFLMDSHYGLGQHTVNIPPENFPFVMKYWLIAAMTWCWTTAAFKASICIFLSRIIIEPVQLIIIWSVLAVSTIGSLALFLLFLLQCSPVDYFWTQYIPPPHHGHCLSQELVADLALGHASLLLIVDFTIVILPVFMVWNLQMSPRTKVSVAVILSLGAVASIATIIRFPYIAIIGKHAKDFPYVTVNHTIWSLVEPGIGIMAAAMATLRPLFRTFLSRSTLWTSHEKSPKEGSGPRVRTVGSYRVFRSWSGTTEGQGDEGDLEALGLRDLRGDLKNGDVGIVTTIEHSRNDSEASAVDGMENASRLHRSSEGTLGEGSTERSSGNHWQNGSGGWVVEESTNVTRTEGDRYLSIV